MLTVRHPKLTLTFPTDWAEVTLGQFLDYITAEPTSRHVLETFASDRAALHQLDAGAEPGVINTLTFLQTLPDFVGLDLPRLVLGVSPPKAINLEPLICIWSFEQWVRDTLPDEEPQTFINTAPGMLGVYLYTPLTGKVLIGSDQIEEVMPQIRSIPVLDALALSAFFLASYSRLPPSGRVSLRISSPKVRPNGWRTRLSTSWTRIASILRLARLEKNGGSPMSRPNS